MSTHAPSRAEIVELVAGLLDRPPAELDPDADLLEAGLGSLELMRLATRWRRAGLEVSYREMVRRPSVTAWEHHLAAAAGGAR